MAGVRPRGARRLLVGEGGGTGDALGKLDRNRSISGPWVRLSLWPRATFIGGWFDISLMCLLLRASTLRRSTRLGTQSPKRY